MDLRAVEFRPFRAGLYFDVRAHRALPWAINLRPVGAKGKKLGDSSPRDDKKPGTVPARKIRRRTATGFFPTVAWPSEAVRVGDESNAFIHKRVEDPFYGPRRRCWSDPSPNAESWRAWLNCPTAGAGWLTGLNDAALGTHFRLGIHGMRGVTKVARRTAWHGSHLANRSLAP
jgi:hypothetical protein